MGFFSRFFSDEPGFADAPVIDADDPVESSVSPLIDYALAIMETGKI
jgi:hypothetical protein